MLYMHTVHGGSPGRSDSDLTARAQIRDAAIECFAQSGFRAPFRDIAATVGVSPALITHHFGSKSRLREECDAEVLRRYHAMKVDALPLVGTGFAGLIDHVTHDQAVITVYILRVLEAGGAAAETFMGRLASQIASVMETYEQAGFIRPTSDEDARARFLSRMMIGPVLVTFLTTQWGTPEEFVSNLLDRNGDFMLPLLELYTYGLLTSSDMLDQYLAARNLPTDTPPTPLTRTHHDQH